MKNLVKQNCLDLSFLINSYREQKRASQRELNILKLRVQNTIKDRNNKINMSLGS